MGFIRVFARFFPRLSFILKCPSALRLPSRIHGPPVVESETMEGKKYCCRKCSPRAMLGSALFWTLWIHRVEPGGCAPCGDVTTPRPHCRLVCWAHLHLHKPSKKVWSQIQARSFFWFEKEDLNLKILILVLNFEKFNNVFENKNECIKNVVGLKYNFDLVL